MKEACRRIIEGDQLVLTAAPGEFIGYRLCRQPLAFLDRKLGMWLGPLQKSLDYEASELQACSLRAFLDRKLTRN